MISFRLLKKSRRSKARLGLLKTPHGTIQTPAFVAVATQGTVKALTPEQVPVTGTQVAICNTFHLHLKPGEKIVAKHGGLHRFTKLPIPLMTDSGGFQIFSLGFGKDLKIGKVGKRGSASASRRVGQALLTVHQGNQPANVRITEKGVWFRSPVDGRKLFLGPKESIKIQQKLGADIILAFDECPPPVANYAYNQASLTRTHAWAKQCLTSHTSTQALFGIVQGGKYKDLRIQSAKFIGRLPFDGFAIGGEFGANLKGMRKMLEWVNAELPEAKPRHLLGIGHLKDIPEVIKSGVDMFDCIVPTHYARHGTAFTNKGRLDFSKVSLLKDKRPIDPTCRCSVCRTHSRAYICHLVRAKEMSGLTLLTLHNLHFFNTYMEVLRSDLTRGKL